MTDARAEAEKLMRNLQREQCYLIMMRPAAEPPPPPKPQPEMRLDHHAWLVGMERAGVLVGAGPCRDAEGGVRGSGLLILRADTRAEAETLAREEPYTKAGQREIDIIPWQRNEGSTVINLRLADGYLEMDRRRWKIGPADG